MASRARVRREIDEGAALRAVGGPLEIVEPDLVEAFGDKLGIGVLSVGFRRGRVDMHGSSGALVLVQD